MQVIFYDISPKKRVPPRNKLRNTSSRASEIRDMVASSSSSLLTKETHKGKQPVCVCMCVFAHQNNRVFFSPRFLLFSLSHYTIWLAATSSSSSSASSHSSSERCFIPHLLIEICLYRSGIIFMSCRQCTRTFTCCVCAFRVEREVKKVFSFTRGKCSQFSWHISAIISLQQRDGLTPPAFYASDCV
jgi:hypothetical protein